ncbi:MFS transporter [Brachybacterium sp. Z12]|nr:MFS transporter [Brachybacterium sp. Z12]
MLPGSPIAATDDGPPAGRAALRAGVVGNWVDNIHVFLPLTALAPAMVVLAGPAAAASTGSLIVVAMLFGRPVGGIVFGRISDRLGRTRTTRVAIAGTAACALAIAVMPTHEILGAGTIALILALRFLGGIFVAGEYSAAIPLAMEWSRPRRRGLMSGLILSMAPWAQASIAFSVAMLLMLLGPDAYAAWGWRLLFVLGALASIGMLIYYSRQVTDAPVFHRRARTTSTQPRAGLRDLLTGRWASTFWQVFLLMTGLWLLTNTTVLLLTGRLGSDTGLPATGVSIAIGIASIAQAVVMALAGHLSTRTGRRTLFMAWGLVAAVLGPLVWWLAVTSQSFGRAAVLAAVLQVITVSAYGPVSAYLSERFPTEVRSTGYGMGYSLSLVLPALYPFYLPWLEALLGRNGSVMALIGLGGGLLVLGAALGPRLSPRDIEADIDTVAEGVQEHTAEQITEGAR